MFQQCPHEIFILFPVKSSKKKSFFGLLLLLKLEKFPLINFSSYSKLKMWKREGSGGVESPVMYFLQMGRGR